MQTRASGRQDRCRGSLSAWHRKGETWLTPGVVNSWSGSPEPDLARQKKSPVRRPAIWISPSQGPVEEAFELPAPDRMLQLAHRLRLDLANALARHLEDAAHLFQRVRVTVAQAVTQLDDLALAIRQGLEHLIDLVLEHLLRGRLHRRFGGVVFDEIAEIAVLALADGTIETDRRPAALEDATRLLDTDVGRPRRFLDGRLAAHLLQQLFRDVAELRHRFDHVHRNADGAGLIGDGASDGLAYPPRRVARELVAAAI